MKDIYGTTSFHDNSVCYMGSSFVDDKESLITSVCMGPDGDLEIWHEIIGRNMWVVEDEVFVFCRLPPKKCDRKILGEL